MTDERIDELFDGPAYEPTEEERERDRRVAEVIDAWELEEFAERARATNGENAEPEDGDQAA